MINVETMTIGRLRCRLSHINIIRLTASSPIVRLPCEIILNIIKFLPPDSMVAFVLATYPIVQQHGLAPRMTKKMLQRLQNLENTVPLADIAWPLPAELTLQILEELPMDEILKFVLENYRLLSSSRIAPVVTRETMLVLCLSRWI